jgi:hypothetical protein
VSGNGRTPTFCVFLVISVAVVAEWCDTCGDREYYSMSGCLASDNAYGIGALNAVDRKSIGHTVAVRSWKDADFLCMSCI